jgi:hypothetical protein
MATPPSNPVKLPLTVVLIVVITIEVIVAAVRGDRVFAVIGVVVLAACVVAVRTIRAGRNPWWLRAPFDRRRPRPPTS